MECTAIMMTVSLYPGFIQYVGLYNGYVYDVDVMPKMNTVFTGKSEKYDT